MGYVEKTSNTTIDNISTKDYTKFLERFSIKPSMSGKGNCYDNAPMESFRGTMKNEFIYHEHYRARVQAIRDILQSGTETEKDLDIYLPLHTGGNSTQEGRLHKYCLCPLSTACCPNILQRNSMGHDFIMRKGS
jgi:hypothetical protein